MVVPLDVKFNNLRGCGPGMELGDHWITEIHTLDTNHTKKKVERWNLERHSKILEETPSPKGSLHIQILQKAHKQAPLHHVFMSGLPSCANGQLGVLARSLCPTPEICARDLGGQKSVSWNMLKEVGKHSEDCPSHKHSHTLLVMVFVK